MLTTRKSASIAPAAAVAILAMGAAGVSLAQAKKAPAPALPEFGVPTGRVAYKISGRMANGTSVLTWTDKALRFRQDADLTVTRGTESMPVKTWMIRDKNLLFSWQPLFGKTVARTNLNDLGGRNPAISGAPLIATGKEGKLVGKATLLGKPCEIRELNGQKIWAWNGIPLKMTIVFKDTPFMEMTATKLETPFRPDAAAFKVPAGYIVKDQSQIRPGAGGAMKPTLQKLPKQAPGGVGGGPK